MRRFLPSVALAALILSTAPFVGLARDAIFERFGDAAVRGMAAGLSLLALAVLAAVLLRIRDRRWLRYGLLVGAGVLLWVQAVGFRTNLPQVNVVEKVHIAEYGLLALLLYFGFRRAPGAGDLTTLLLPLAWVAVAGTLDEWLQWLVETRTGEIRDVVLNLLAGSTGLLVAVALAPPDGFAWRLGAPGWRRLGRAAAGATLLVGAFFYNAHLGYLVEDPEIGRFCSWHDREGLLQAAAERQLRWQQDPPKELSPWRKEDLFLTEAGAHNLYRNASYKGGDLLAARRANLILERYFTPYLDLKEFRRTGDRRFPPHAMQKLAQAPRGDPARFVSPVLAKRIYIRPSKPVFAAGLALVVTALWGLPRLLARRSRNTTFATGC